MFLLSLAIGFLVAILIPLFIYGLGGVILFVVAGFDSRTKVQKVIIISSLIFVLLMVIVILSSVLLS